MPEAQVYPPSEKIDILSGKAASVAGQTFNVTRCAACDNRHDNMEMNDYARAPKPFTHWYKCPNTGDPVPVSLVMLKTGEGMELNGPVCQSLAAAQACGRFLVAIFWHNENGMLTMAFNEEKFPTGDYFETKEHKGVLGMLREQFERNVGTPEQREMQAAALPKPLRDLVGNSQPVSVERKQYKMPSGFKMDDDPTLNAIKSAEQIAHAINGPGASPQE